MRRFHRHAKVGGRQSLPLHLADQVGEDVAEILLLRQELRHEGRLGQPVGFQSRPAGWETAQLVVPGQVADACGSRRHHATPSADAVGGSDWSGPAGRLRFAPSSPTPRPPSHDMPDERAPRPESDVHQGHASRRGGLHGEVSLGQHAPGGLAIRQGAVLPRQPLARGESPFFSFL